VRYLVGIGNYTMGDDGIGLRLIESMVDRKLDKGFVPVDIGNDLFRLLTFFEPTTERLVIVDCVHMGRQPGEWVCFSPAEVESRKVVGRFTTHEGDVLKIIDLARQLGQHVPELFIIGIEPESVTPCLTLSRPLETRFEEYLQTAIDRIGQNETAPAQNSAPTAA
jgi:hydrogenase maturation protease